MKKFRKLLFWKEGERMNSLKSLREQAKLTQEDIAYKLNIDRSAIAKWETGEAMPRADKLPQLAQILGCTIDELFARP